MKPLQDLNTFPKLSYPDNAHFFFEKISSLESSLHSHLFSEKLQLIIPSNEALDESRILEQLGLPRNSGVVFECALEKFLDKGIVEKLFLNSFSAGLSLGSLDVDDIVCILPNGVLYFDLKKDTYEKCGLSGRRKNDSLIRKTPDFHRYIVTVDLLGPLMMRRTKYRERVEWCFRNNFPKQFRFQFLSTELVSGKPLADYSHFSPDVTPIPVSCSLFKRIENCAVPRFLSLIEKKQLSEVLEWIGIASAGLENCLVPDLLGKVDPYLSLYNLPEETEVKSDLLVVGISGFFLPCQVLKCCEFVESQCLAHSNFTGILNCITPAHSPIAVLKPIFQASSKKRIIETSSCSIDNNLTVQLDLKCISSKVKTPCSYGKIVERLSSNTSSSLSRSILMISNTDFYMFQS